MVGHQNCLKGWVTRLERTKRRQPGLDNKAGGRVDCGEKRHKIPLYPHMPHPPQVGLQAEGAKKDAPHCVQRGKGWLQKKVPGYLWTGSSNKKEEKEGFTLVSLDESFFFYDSLVRRVWVDEKKRPVVRVTGSHKHSCLFGAMNMEGKPLSDSTIDSTVIRSKVPKDNSF